MSRNQNDLSAQYPELANIGNSVNGKVAVLDGEIVALDEQGISRFQLLQSRMGRKNAAEIAKLAGKTRVAYYVFDLLHLDGFDLTACPLVERKTKLQSLIKGKNVRYSDHIIEHGEKLYEEIVQVPLEGMIAKRLDSVYSQRRSHDWLKIKTVLESDLRSLISEPDLLKLRPSTQAHKQQTTKNKNEEQRTRYKEQNLRPQP